MTGKFLHIAAAAIIFAGTLPGTEPDSSVTGSNPSEDGSGGITLKQWGEFYDESMTIESEENNLFSNSHIRQGLKVDHLPGINLMQAYVLVRYGRDLHRDFWNNKTEAGLGLRIRFFEKIFFAPYVELIRGFYNQIPGHHPRPGTRQYTDFRGGFIFWYGWDTWYEPASLITFPGHFTGEVYSELNYFRKDRDNIILYVHIKAGVRMIRIWKCACVGYGAAYIMKDTNRDFWNNAAEIGPGIWIKPHPDFDLKFFVEWLRGYYYGIEGRDENPYPQIFDDRRMGILLWIGW
ncbi:hypothetical protein JW948_14400 [bacterium]|nr:hypothetical protein [bacterium]